MIAWIVFVLLFVVLGLSVVAMAMSGGPKGLRAVVQTQSRTGRKVAAVLLGAIIVLVGVAIPVALGYGNADRGVKAVPSSAKLTTAQAQRGRQLFARYCANCHTLAAVNAVGKVGPNLDNLRPPEALIIDAVTHGRARGQGQMPAGLLAGQDLKDVAAFVAAVAGR
jgi:mono/diheme cytochrome c family protein